MSTQKPKTTKKEDEGEQATTVKAEIEKGTTNDYITTSTESISTTTTSYSDVTSITESVDNTTAGKTGLTKHYRDGENDISGGTITTTPATKVSSTTPGKGEDVKGPFDYRTTPKMKTTRIDTSNEMDEFNITTLLTTTPKYDSTTFPVMMVTEDSQSSDNLTTPMSLVTEKPTMFPVITPEITTPTQEPVTMAGTTITNTPEFVEPLTTTTTTKEILTSDITTLKSETPSTMKPQIIEDMSSTMFPVITEKITEISEIPGTTTSLSPLDMEMETTGSTKSSEEYDLVTDKGVIDSSTPESIITTTIIPSISTTTPSTLITIINTTCTVHTNCAPNQLCIMGQCRFKCRGDGTNENNCVQGINLL